MACFAFDPTRSALCQGQEWTWSTGELVETGRLNSIGAYPPVYYAVTGLVTGHDIVVSALLMRGLSVMLVLALCVTLFVSLPFHRRPALIWSLLLTSVPLGLFLFGTNNPSLWAWVGIAAAPVALMGYYESAGRRKLALAGLFGISVLAAAGSRSDAAIFACIAIGAVGILAFKNERQFFRDSLLPLAFGLVSIAFFTSAFLARRGLGGYAGQVIGPEGEILVESDPSGNEQADGPTPPSSEEADVPLNGFGLLASNILNIPRLWTGVFGDRWGLGWLDTSMPSIVPAATIAAFVLVGALGIARPTLRRSFVIAGLVVALVLIPVIILQTGGFEVGEQVQPRYLLPLVALLAAILTMVSASRPLLLTSTHRLLVIVALASAHFVALHINLRRYVTGIDQPGPSLDAGREWWWGGPIGPTAVWVIGSVAFTMLVIVLVNAISKAIDIPTAALTSEPAPVR